MSSHDILEPSATWPDTDSDCDLFEDNCDWSSNASLTPQHYGGSPSSSVGESPTHGLAQMATDVAQTPKPPSALKLEVLLPLSDPCNTISHSDTRSTQSCNTPSHQVDSLAGGSLAPVLLGRTKVGSPAGTVDGSKPSSPGPVLHGCSHVGPFLTKVQHGIEDISPGDRIAYTSQQAPTQQIEIASCLDEAVVPAAHHTQEKPEEVTTMMIRNLPRSLTQSTLITALDNCGFKGLYDFCYLPCSFDSCQNKGFAFVNFTSPSAAGMLVGRWHSKKPFAGADGVRPPLSLCPALVQGLEANLKKWNQPRCKRIRNPNLRPYVVDAQEERAASNAQVPDRKSVV